jgi:hypothetical protein
VIVCLLAVATRDWDRGFKSCLGPACLPSKNRGSSVGVVTGYGLDDRMIEVRFPVGLGIFLFTTPSRPTLRPTQPPIQWVAGALSLGVKREEREADHSHPSSADVKECVDPYLHSSSTSS